jgi:enamine deaminase RidA (YjgF/YER057c/UK114 family)
MILMMTITYSLEGRRDQTKECLIMIKSTLMTMGRNLKTTLCSKTLYIYNSISFKYFCVDDLSKAYSQSILWWQNPSP